jgi:hypothetical protein
VRRIGHAGDGSVERRGGRRPPMETAPGRGDERRRTACRLPTGSARASGVDGRGVRRRRGSRRVA